MSSIGSDGRTAGTARDGGGDAVGSWPGPDCPPSAALERLVLGTASTEDREALVDHLTGCEGCAAVVRDLRSLEGWAKRVAAEHGSPIEAGERRHPPEVASHRRRRGILWPLALAATLVLALGGAFLWRQVAAPPSAGDRVRGEPATVYPAPGARLERLPARFDWPDRPGASGYRVRLFDPQGELVWESGWLPESASAVPEEPAAARPEDGLYIWTVESRGTVGGPRLGPFTFVLAGRESPPHGPLDES